MGETGRIEERHPLQDFWRSVSGPYAELTGPLIRYAAKVAEAERNTLAAQVASLTEQVEQLTARVKQLTELRDADERRILNLTCSQTDITHGL